MKCNLIFTKNKVYLPLKLKSNKKSINIGVFKTNNSNTIHILIVNMDKNKIF